jgi:hypothetical protein
MVKLVVCCGAPEDSAAFDRHYAETHARWGVPRDKRGADVATFASGGATLMIVET